MFWSVKVYINWFLDKEDEDYKRFKYKENNSIYCNNFKSKKNFPELLLAEYINRDVSGNIIEKLKSLNKTQFNIFFFISNLKSL